MNIMQINRNNYEEFFILYMDNELDATSRLEVEAFAAAHPDLREELDLLMQTQFTPDISLEYGDKSELMQFDTTSGINAGNYESWLLMYADNELSAADKIITEKFIASHATAAQELWLLKEAHLEPEQIIFEGKESLYRKEEKSRPFIRWQMAAAAVLLLVVSTTALILNNSDSDQPTGTDGPRLASIDKSEKTQTPVKIVTVEEQPELLQPKSTEESTTIAPTSRSSKETKKNNAPVEAIKHINDQLKNTTTDVANVSSKTTGSNTNVERVNPFNTVSTEKAQSGSQMINDASIANAKMTQQQNSNTPTVTTKATDPFNLVDEPVATNDIINASESTGKKSKLRGFFRKVTRTFEKKTNINPTDEDDRLLVGGLAIRLK
jgi:hypothetical protein